MRASPNSGQRAARLLFDYLALRTEVLGRSDLIMGFGHFDPKIPRHCGGLWRQHLAPRILFTGGVGAGSADLGQPEAHYLRQVLLEAYPEIPSENVWVEATSTHTGENLTHSIALLDQSSPDWSFCRGISRVILVANAYRQRRVWLTCRHHLPEVELLNAPPPTTFEREYSMFADKGQNLMVLLVGEIQRIQRYGALGYIERCELPRLVSQAQGLLRAALVDSGVKAI
ncbi:MAG: YdcF family protein [Anaerolineae bacterium]